MNKSLFFMATIFSILLLVSCSYQVNNPELGIQGTFLSRFKLNTIFQNDEYFLYEAKSENEILRIYEYNNISDKKSFMSSKLFFIKSLYRQLNSPYPGQVSNKISCSSEFLPKKVSDDVYKLYATPRLTFGACACDLIEYDTWMYFKQCNDNEVYIVEIYVPVNQTDNSILENIECMSN